MLQREIYIVSNGTCSDAERNMNMRKQNKQTYLQFYHNLRDPDWFIKQ